MSVRFSRYKIHSCTNGKKRKIRAKIRELVVLSFLRSETVVAELERFAEKENVEFDVTLYGDYRRPCHFGAGNDAV